MANFSQAQQKVLEDNKDLINSVDPESFNELVRNLNTTRVYSNLTSNEYISLVLCLTWVKLGSKGFGGVFKKSPNTIDPRVIVYSNKTGLKGFKGRAVLPSMYGKGKVSCYKINGALISDVEVVPFPKDRAEFIALANKWDFVAPYEDSVAEGLRATFNGTFQYSASISSFNSNREVVATLEVLSGRYSDDQSALDGLGARAIANLVSKVGDGLKNTVEKVVRSVFNGAEFQ